MLALGPFGLSLAALLWACSGQGIGLAEEGAALSLLQHSHGNPRRARDVPQRSPQPGVAFWGSKNGDLLHTGASAFRAPGNLSAGPAWKFKGGLVRTAPLIDEKRNIFLSTVPGMLHKLSPEGRPLWKYHAKAGIPMVPALAGGYVYAATNAGEAFALSAATGALLWRRRVAPCAGPDTGSITATASAVVLALANRASCMVNSMVLTLDANTGAELWRFHPDLPLVNFLGAVVSGTPGDTLVFSDMSGRVYRLDLATGHVLWKFNDTNPLDSSTGGAIVGPNRMVYVTSNIGGSPMSAAHGRLSAFDLETGRRVWYQDTEFPANNAAAVGSLSPAGTGGLSVVIGVGDNPWLPPQRSGKKRGAVLAFDAETGKPTSWRFSPPVWQHEAAAGDTIIPLHVCLPDSFSNPAIGGDGTVYIGFQDGRLYALRDADGNGQLEPHEVSAFDTKNAFQGSPGIAPGMLVATPCDGMYVFTEAAA